MKLFIPEKFEKLPVSKYFKLATDYGIVVKKIVNVQFEMTAIPRWVQAHCAKVQKYEQSKIGLQFFNMCY